jgi:hypothetical protein
MDRRHMPPLEMVGSRLEKVTELANCNEKGHDPTADRKPRGLTVRERSVEVKCVFIMPKIKFQTGGSHKRRRDDQQQKEV